MKKKMLFIFNPHAGKSLIRNKLVDILDIFVKAGYEVVVYPTQAPQDGLDKTRAEAGNYDLIVCSGGDGTLDEIITGMMQSNVKAPIGYIPSGSTNDFATSLKIPKNMIKAAEVAVGDNSFLCDIGRFNQDYFVYIAAFGLFTDVSYKTNQDVKNLMGHVAYILEGVKRLPFIKSYFLKVEYDGNVIEDEFIYGMITNSTSVGGFKNMTGKNVHLDDGVFEVTLIKNPTNPIELQSIINSLVLRVDDTASVYSFKTSHIKISAKTTMSWTLDGEFGGDHEVVEIVNEHKALGIKVGLKEKLIMI